jgi:hypothetical protein
MVEKQASGDAERKVIDDQHGRAFARDRPESQDLKTRPAKTKSGPREAGRS